MRSIRLFMFLAKPFHTYLTTTITIFILPFNIVFVSSKCPCLPIHFHFSDSNTHMMLHLSFSHPTFHCFSPPLKSFSKPFQFHGPSAAKLSICSTSPLNGEDESVSSFLSLKVDSFLEI